MKPFKPIYTGSSYPLNLEYKDQAKVAIDITGSTAELVLRKNVHDSEAAATATATIDGLNGLISFELTPAQTKTLLDNTEKEKDKFMLGAVLTLTSGKKITLFQTSVDVIRSVV